MSSSSQYMENIRIMADSVVLSIEIPMMISMEGTTLLAMMRMFSISYPYDLYGKNSTVGQDTHVFHMTGVGHKVYTLT